MGQSIDTMTCSCRDSKCMGVAREKRTLCRRAVSEGWKRDARPLSRKISHMARLSANWTAAHPILHHLHGGMRAALSSSLAPLSRLSLQCGKSGEMSCACASRISWAWPSVPPTLPRAVSLHLYPIASPHPLHIDCVGRRLSQCRPTSLQRTKLPSMATPNPLSMSNRRPRPMARSRSLRRSRR
ncbi:hypothetical protein BDY17DRAFT_197235 [Neohortaea acidophila]|uniref:Uncharacterized protein n=1 Tax=Neohortaea acidophila TaxID=245834 RepID=A0A6A6PKS4_9PEZI|nr:uncharacterized protein BDY17DRAFT_197235 [Neohortaea acidophila]KAF2480660.1 hypothetical protein BDY17DRAFT_197235 [Neohortaea acidophila]